MVLLHSPVTNRRGELVTTAVTNMDIHDIARTSRTYGVRSYFLVTPIRVQHAMVSKILTHWSTEQSKAYHPDRFEALELVRVAADFEEVINSIKQATGAQKPFVVLTDARETPQSMTYPELRKFIDSEPDGEPVVLVFGTGWGVSDRFYPAVDRILAPVHGPEGSQYNHLSVRSAVAIILDRLLSRQTEMG